MDKWIPEATKKDLRNFGITMAVAFSGIFGLIFPWILKKSIIFQSWPFAASGVFLTMAILFPIILKPVYIIWMAIAFCLGWINTRIILGLVYFLVFTPVSIFMKLFRKDPMNRVYDSKTLSYFKQTLKDNEEHMERPY